MKKNKKNQVYQQTQGHQLCNVSVKAMGYTNASEFLNSFGILETKHSLAACGLFVYTFRVSYAGKEWSIRRRVQDFQELEKTISKDPLFRFKPKNINKESVENQPQQVMADLAQFLISLIRQQDMNENPPIELLLFLELSYVEHGSRTKYRECFLKKKAGGRFAESKCARCGTLWGKWDSRYFIITSEAIMYAKGPDQQHCQVREVLAFDYNFTVLHGKQETGHERGIVLNTTTRQLVLNAPDLFQFILFLQALQEALRNSPYTALHRFDSFAPERSGCSCKWYVDGEFYFCDVQKAILKAKESVQITDWWLSPEVYLSRPLSKNEDDLSNRESRLDIVLKNVADRGVQVQIIVYQEPTVALNNDSVHTKSHLESLSVNIQVLRHPSQTIPYLWSHHEKMVIVDQQIGFLGGLDLCYGRYDDQKHRLFDISEEKEVWPGIDYCNMRKKDFVNVRNHSVSQISKARVCRMPWHDVAMQVQGEVVIDLCRHFIQYWNHVIIEQNFKERTGIKMLQQVQQQQNMGYQRFTENQRGTVVIGKEFEHGHYEAFIKQLEQEVQHNSYPNLDEGSKPSIQYEEELKQDPTNSFHAVAKRRVTLVNEQHKINNEIFQIIKSLHNNPNDFNNNLMPNNNNNNNNNNNEQQQDYKRLSKITHQSNYHLIQNQISQQQLKQIGNCECQMLRSSSTWSVGCKPINNELSIQVAYIQLIGEAKHFIYIENQFFISSTAGSQVENKVAQALIARIKEAHRLQQLFKVIVFIPLLPGFEGEIDDGNSSVMKIQLHWEYQTISRGNQCILQQLKSFVDDPSEYIEFYSLRTHTKNLVDSTPTTEIIYIHSKLMIIDDDIVLMGSANINDRSLLGSRDSEIAMLTKDKNKVQSLMAGQIYFTSKFAHTLRTSLYQEHFDMTYQQVQDPLSSLLQEKIRFQTNKNTLIYRTVFACYPDDTVQSLSEYEQVTQNIIQNYLQFKQKQNLSTYDQYASEIIGNAVQFPLDFLKNENLKIGIFNREYLCPDINFT